ncbi:unnamed protein product, partial [Acanthoscelides obtectus]
YLIRFWDRSSGIYNFGHSSGLEPIPKSQPPVYSVNLESTAADSQAGTEEDISSAFHEHI